LWKLYFEFVEKIESLRVMWKSYKEGIECVHREQRRNFVSKLGEKTESLRILENSARWALSWCKCAQKNSFEFREEKKCHRRRHSQGY
jgi:hypothetical protein